MTPSLEWTVLVIAGLMAASVLARSLAGRFGLPALIGFLLLGMAAGSEGPGGIAFADYGAAQAAGVMSLVIILYASGLAIRTRDLSRVLAPALVLSTFGVVISTAIIAGTGMALFGWTPVQGLLFGARSCRPPTPLRFLRVLRAATSISRRGWRP